MSSFTYESKESKQTLETFEWDNVWIDHANDTQTPRVLYIGDSISCGTRRIATECAQNKILFDGFGTSKALDNPFFWDALYLFAKQQPKQDAIIINNGLHGWHLNDEQEYPKYYKAFIQKLLTAFPDTPVLLLLTTSVSDKARESRVQKRNQAVLDIAQELHLDIIDLYEVSTALEKPDGVHLTQEGYIKLAQTIVAKLQNILS